METQKKVLFVDPVHESLQRKLEELNYQCDSIAALNGSTIEDSIKNYHGIVIRSKFRLNKEILSKATNLKFIARAGAGMESIDVDFAESLGIKCIRAPEGNKDAVADHAIGMLLALFNNLTNADAEVRRGMWHREANRGVELTGKTVGIIGYGFTGSEFAKRLNGFDTKVLVYDKYKTNYSDEYAIESTMEEIFEEADVLSIHLPLTEETDYLVNYEFIHRFKKNIYLINTSRGKVVKTSDLVKTLESGKILGACLDVLEYESASFERLSGLSMWTNKRGVLVNRIWKWLVKIGWWKYLHPVQYLVKSDRVLLSPHVAGWSFESYEKISKILAERIKAIH